MFARSGWFAIDAGNARVAGVVVPSLEAGLGLVGSGPVASVVGRLRPGVVAVDIDVDGDRGHAAAEAIAGWCVREGLWHLVRPSGGGAGRCHVFVVHAGRVDALTAVVEELRASMRVGVRRIDVRRDVRPLSAPHRSTGPTPAPYGDVATALAELPGPGLAPADKPSSSRRRGGGGTSPVAALAPRPRPRRDLPPQWQEYLTAGVAPVVGGEDHTRSTVEAIVTGHLLRAGHDAVSAWEVVQGAHPEAMTRARANHRRWIQWVWNRAVRDDEDFSPTARTDPDVAAAVDAARDRLTQVQWDHPPRRRAALLLVGHQVLDRMARTNSLRVPVPERDLVLDTGLTDRKVVRAALRALNGPVGLLDTTVWSPVGARDSSSFEFEIPRAEAPGDGRDGQGVREIPPPRSHTPLPHGIWRELPAICHALWRTLTRPGAPRSAADLGSEVGITERPGEELSPTQVRTVRAGLAVLAQVGLASCGSSGLWISGDRVDHGTSQRAAAAHAARAAAVAEERRVYRAGRASSWNAARAAAEKACRARQRAWWDGLCPRERADRALAWARRFETLSVLDQERCKARLADRRIVDGVDEPARHDAWLDALHPEEFAERAASRAAWFDRLAPALQQAYVAAWSRHRGRYGIRRGTTASAVSVEHAQLLPGARARDQAFLQQELPVARRAAG